MTIAELLRELERYNVTAERKSLYDDMEALRSYGLDVQRTGHRYYLLSHTFELAELKLLVDAIQSSRFLTHKKSQELIKKLEGLTSIHPSPDAPAAGLCDQPHQNHERKYLLQYR